MLQIINPRELYITKDQRENEGCKKGGKSLVNGESKGFGRQKIDMGWGKEVFG